MNKKDYYDKSYALKQQYYREKLSISRQNYIRANKRFERSRARNSFLGFFAVVKLFIPLLLVVLIFRSLNNVENLSFYNFLQTISESEISSKELINAFSNFRTIHFTRIFRSWSDYINVAKYRELLLGVAFNINALLMVVQALINNAGEVLVLILRLLGILA